MTDSNPRPGPARRVEPEPWPDPGPARVVELQSGDVPPGLRAALAPRSAPLARETGARLGTRIGLRVLRTQATRALARATARAELAREALLSELAPEARRLALEEAARVVELLRADLAEEDPGPGPDYLEALQDVAGTLRLLAEAHRP